MPINKLNLESLNTFMCHNNDVNKTMFIKRHIEKLKQFANTVDTINISSVYKTSRFNISNVKINNESINIGNHHQIQYALENITNTGKILAFKTFNAELQNILLQDGVRCTTYIRDSFHKPISVHRDINTNISGYYSLTQSLIFWDKVRYGNNRVVPHNKVPETSILPNVMKCGRTYIKTSGLIKSSGNAQVGDTISFFSHQGHHYVNQSHDPMIRRLLIVQFHIPQKIAETYAMYDQLRLIDRTHKRKTEKYDGYSWQKGTIKVSNRKLVTGFYEPVYYRDKRLRATSGNSSYINRIHFNTANLEQSKINIIINVIGELLLQSIQKSQRNQKSVCSNIIINEHTSIPTSLQSKIDINQLIYNFAYYYINNIPFADFIKKRFDVFIWLQSKEKIVLRPINITHKFTNIYPASK